MLLFINQPSLVRYQIEQFGVAFKEWSDFAQSVDLKVVSLTATNVMHKNNPNSNNKFNKVVFLERRLIQRKRILELLPPLCEDSCQSDKDYSIVIHINMPSPKNMAITLNATNPFINVAPLFLLPYMV